MRLLCRLLCGRLASVRHAWPALQGFEAFDAAEKGAWEELSAGGAALRLNIRSPGAGSHVVVFRCGKPLRHLIIACHPGNLAFQTSIHMEHSTLAHLETHFMHMPGTELLHHNKPQQC